MPRGSKPGERRGGRQRGTPNKSTALKNAAFTAAVTDPNLMPLDFFLTLMRQADLPLEFRVAAAQQALPLAHRKPKPANDTYGRSGTVVNKKIGPRVQVVKVASDAEPHNVTPLDFLLGVMRDANNDPALRLRTAGLVAPYVHPKGEPNEAPSEYTHVKSANSLTQLCIIEPPRGKAGRIDDVPFLSNCRSKRLSSESTSVSVVSRRGLARLRSVGSFCQPTILDCWRLKTRLSCHGFQASKTTPQKKVLIMKL